MKSLETGMCNVYVLKWMSLDAKMYLCSLIVLGKSSQILSKIYFPVHVSQMITAVADARANSAF
jgi:hypothetical protein